MLFEIHMKNDKGEELVERKRAYYFMTVTTKIFKFEKLLCCFGLRVVYYYAVVSLTYFLYIRNSCWNKVKVNRIATFTIARKGKP